MPRSASVGGLAKRGVIPRKQFYIKLFFSNTVILGLSPADSVRIPKRLRADHNPKKYFLSPIYRPSAHFSRLFRSGSAAFVCYCGIVKGSFRTESFPMENCRRRQSSSVSVLLPTVSAQPKRKRGGRRLSAAGIDSWQRVVRPRYSYHLHDSRHFARSPEKGTGR